ncbi:PEP-CTERM sorting domain-containing protein [Paucibacter sp. B2R-40]|uniref:PEP-CTERM sorting domain-containing protein n=1 Tax=Paucibacter sp. B2R-40 TaxID=2893554 RepID=UPI0021E4FD38|nr:PEP-CTERM sorting domain-containing protein [Paucibacter sp. B2R-40]
MRSNNYFTLRALAVAAILAGSGQAKADLTFFNNQAAYMAAISAPGVDNFEDLPWAVIGQSVNRQAGEHYYSAWAVEESGNYTDLYTSGSSADQWLSTDRAADYLTFGYFSEKVNGAGGFFFGSDEMGNFKAGQTIRINAIDADGVEQIKIVENATPGSFYGFVSSSHLEYFQVSAVQPNGDYTWVAGNDLALGTIAAAVPEPASYALLLAGLGLLGAVAQRKRA